jgi:hypothetical protein
MSERGRADGNVYPFPAKANGGLTGGGGGPRDPGMEARMTAIEQRMGRLETNIDGLDSRLRSVETSLARVEGKIDTLGGAMVAQTSAALAKLPSWWQIPAAIASTMALLVAAFAGVKYLLVHGLL